MKYIKLFNESNDNKLYQEIDFYEHDRLRNEGRYEKFTKYEFNEINKIPFMHSPGKIAKNPELKYNGESIWIYQQQGEFTSNVNIVIDKISDDWFLIKELRTPVGTNIRLYKCDTFNGVLQYLNDFLYIKSPYT